MDHPGLDDHQQALLAQWAPHAALVHDHSWGLVQTTVLELEDPERGTVILKAGGPADHHLARSCVRIVSGSGPGCAPGMPRSCSPPTRRRSC
ncbi:hypothetical protein [Brachybacterium sp. Z12]|uniref:hypothetical protein n=1 Tax=Brachybacterium sp. Z12 TaxID=2759167 RepID=UPI00223B867D|nr:hypothetical protein [Brachybacterium sp. Z12]